MEFWIIITVAILFFSWRMIPTKDTKKISTDTRKSMLRDKDKVFVDVRTPAEYKGKNIYQFKNIPLGTDLSKLPKDKEIVLICQSGIRSAQACKH